MLLVAAIALLLLLGLLLLPVAIRLRVERPEPATPMSLELGWAFFTGLVGFQVERQKAGWHLYPRLLGRRLSRVRLPLRAEVTHPARVEAPRPSPPPLPEPDTASEPVLERLSRWVDLLGPPGLRLGLGLAQVLRLRRLHLQGRFGFADPARTGSVFGYLQGLSALGPRRVWLDLQPDFEQPGVRGELRLLLHLYLGYLFFVLLRFAVQVGWRWLRIRLALLSLPGKPRTA